MQPGVKLAFNNKKLRKMLTRLPDRIQRRVLRQAMGPASTPLVKATKRLAPKRHGWLKKAIGRKMKTYTRTNTVVAIVGPRTNVSGTTGKRFHRPSKYAHLVDGGAKPHTITLNLKDGRKVTVNHPGTKPTRFMRRAEESTRAERIRIATEKAASGTVREAAALGM